MGSNFYRYQNEGGKPSAQLFLTLRLPPQTRYTTSKNSLVTMVLDLKLVYKLRVLLTGLLGISNRRRLVTGPTSPRHMFYHSHHPSDSELLTLPLHPSSHPQQEAECAQPAPPSLPKQITTLPSHYNPTKTSSMLIQLKASRRRLNFRCKKNYDRRKQGLK